MTDQLDRSELTSFADWCRAKDNLPTAAKRTVEALLYQVDRCSSWAGAENAIEALGLEWEEWRSQKGTQCDCDLADRILSN
jgi:hypothetical protein